MVKENLQAILEEIKNGNPYGEKVTLVGATKFMPVELINEGKKISLIEEQEFLTLLGEFGAETFDYLTVVKEYDKQRLIKREAFRQNKKQNKEKV